MMPFDTKNPVDEQATIDQVLPRDANIFNFAVAAIHRGLLALLARLCPDHCLPGYGFVINALVGSVYIKSLGGFPFKTHLNTMRISVASLFMYGLATIAYNVISATCLNFVVYARIAVLVKIACLFILVGSLASLFIF